jgi:hypothetical protein
LPRAEHEIFNELAGLCVSPGYAHAVAHLCFRDNIIRYAGEMTAENMERMSSMERLSRSEISTLIGLMVKAPIDCAMPDPKAMQGYITGTDRLLSELHQVMSAESFQVQDWKKMAEEGINPFQHGGAFREPIFYGGESAYSFQYRDLAPRKYTADDGWLEAHKGFTIGTAQAVVRAIGKLQRDKLHERLDVMRELPPNEWTVLPAHTFAANEVAVIAGISPAQVDSVLSAFTLPEDHRNESFRALDDFNAANALPLLKIGQDEFLLFQTYSLVEALYESPFYWMLNDKTYRGTATNNRGRFTEEFAKNCLELVFGKANVYSNINIYETKGKILGEIDVLVVFANRAIVVQAKSKRLTIEARKGNDQIIKDDFKKSVQDSYDQGRLCASMLSHTRYTLADQAGEDLNLVRHFKEIYIFCVVSDHYPALSFQARKFLKHQETDIIKPPFILDVFTLDAISEMLQSPLRFLSYVNRRTLYTDRLMASQELTILSYHLTQNLWLDDEHDLVILGDELSADLDIAMSARRDGIAGKVTPEGILTRFAGTTLWHLVEDIEARAAPGIMDLGFLLLSLSGDTLRDGNAGIDQAVAKTRRDGQTHDLTLVFGDSGFTVHCTDAPMAAALPALQRHCERRKYTHRANSWFGVCLRSSDARLRFGVCLDYPWMQDAAMDEATENLPKPAASIKAALSAQCQSTKVGRNDPCHCGSGRKYKKCCLR